MSVDRQIRRALTSPKGKGAIFTALVAAGIVLPNAIPTFDFQFPRPAIIGVAKPEIILPKKNPLIPNLASLPLMGAGLGVDSSAAPLAFDATDARVNEAVGFTTTASYSTVAIGPATGGREVVVGVAAYLGGSSGTISGVTVNAVGITERKNNANTANPTGIWSGNVTSGTSVTIVVTCTATIQICSISVGYFNNAVTAGTGQMRYAPGDQNSPYTVSSPITVAAGGFGIGFFWQASGALNAAWANLTNDAGGGADGATNRVIMGYTSTPGSISPSATAPNFAVTSLIAVPFA